MSQISVGKLLASVGVKLPVYTSDTRPATAETGTLIFNTTTQAVELWSGSSWASIGSVSDAITATVTGGNVYIDGTYSLAVFTGPGSFQVTKAAATSAIDLLVVGGGGQGAQDSPAGGGGGGGFRYITGVPVTTTTYSVSVGQIVQGNMAFAYGNPSVAFGYTATGGGGGAGSAGGGTGQTVTGYPGGSGGGGGSGSGGSGNSGGFSPPEGFPGSPGSGGGGGAGGAGSGTSGGTGAQVPASFLPNGVSGMPDPFLGIAKSSPEFRYFGGGGGGYSNGAAGLGGGGAGGNSGPRIAIAGRGGGGGAYYGPWTPNWTKGESGVVIVRYKTA
jgi:hypothetical protein